jgi:hypothetical protein
MKMSDKVATHELARYDAMCRAIAEAREIDEVKDIRDKSGALEMYARQANDRDLERKVRDIRIRAESKAGELLAVREMSPAGRPPINRSSHTTDLPQKLSDTGISKDQSSQWQKLAAIPRDEFEEALADPVWTPTSRHRRDRSHLQRPIPLVHR